MKYSGWFLVLLVMLSSFSNMAFAQNSRDEYITWNDLRVDKWEMRVDDIRGSDLENDSVSRRVIVVDQNGGGHSTTLQGAVDMVPVHNTQRVKILIRPGIYREKVHVPASKPYISFIGDRSHPDETVITWHDKAGDLDENGIPIGTYKSASVTVDSDYFCAVGITFENSIVQTNELSGAQAVAFKISGDRAFLFRNRFIGSQDTLADQKGSHYFFQCYIFGRTDFIFGRGTSIYEQCTISMPDNGYAIAAHHRESSDEETGFSFVNCRIIGNGSGALLGRAWAPYSRILYLNTDIDINVHNGGWSDWGDPARQKTAEFGEFNCYGRGADRSGRVQWSKTLDHTQAKPLLDKSFISANKWLKLGFGISTSSRRMLRSFRILEDRPIWESKIGKRF